MNVAHLLQRGPHARELSLVKVEPFSGKEEEDPHEWMEALEQAAAANQWPDARLVDIALGYLKGAARDWYVAKKNEILQWNDWEEGHGDNAVMNEGFKTKFLKFFTPEVKQNQWYHELMTI